MKNQLTCTLLWILLALPPIASPQKASWEKPKNEGFFPVSVWYSGGKARAPMLSAITPDSEKQWRKDLHKIKSLGFNTVRTWVDWSKNEPREGEFHFENLQLLLQLAEEQDLRVIVQVYVDSAPDWVGRKYPDGHFVAQNGAVIESQSAPGYCFDNTGVRKAVLNYFQQVAKVASASKAFYAYDLWSEPHVINWAEIDYIPNAQFCYCPYTLARFREWLKQKYGTLEALNKAWYRGFDNWEQVEPPRFATILSYADYMDWRIFMGDKLAQDLASRSRAVKQVDPLHLTTSHAAIPSVFQTLADGTGAPDDYLMKDSVDYYGTSFYPKLTSPATHWTLARRMLVMDSVKSVTGGRGFYVGELQGGFGVHGVTVSQPIEPHELELYTWGMVARGARAINYYAFYPMSSGYESGGYGLINLDGTLTERSKAAGATAKIISEHADLFLNAKPAPSPVALIYNPLTSLVGGQVFAARMAMRDAIAGYHRMFYERNVSMDIVSAREITGRSLAQYKLVVAPYPILMTEELAKALEEYVQGGGHLLLEARPGWVDDHGFAQPVIPGLGLEKVTGVREREVDPVNDFKIRWGNAEFGAASMEEKFTVLDPKATVVAQFEDGTPAAYEHSYGAGSAMILGGFAGNYNEKNPVSMNPLGEKLMQWAGIEAPEMKASAPVEVREMTSGGKRLVFFFNHTDKSAAVEYTTPVRSVADFQELISGESQKLGRALSFELPAQSVKVWVYSSVLIR